MSGTEELRERIEAAIEDWFNHLADDDEPTVEQIGQGVAAAVLAVRDAEMAEAQEAEIALNARKTAAILEAMERADQAEADRDEEAHSAVSLRCERDALKTAVLDIDAHATPYGDLPDDPGYVGTYLVTAGALHRALGKIGHTAPKCQAEAERDALKTAADEAVDHLLKIAAWGIHDSKRSDLRTIALAIRAVVTGETTVDEMRATIERIFHASKAPGGES